MNIIELVKNILQTFPEISEVCNEIHVDFTEDTPVNYGLSSTGDTLLKRYVNGDEKRVHTFILFAVWQSLNDYDRMVNSGALLALQHWLENYSGDTGLSETINNINYSGELTRLNCTNGMLEEIPDENFNTFVRYQIQITANYNLYKEI